MAVNSIRKELEGFQPGYEIIAADGGSNDGAVPWLCKQKDIVLILQHNHGRWKGKRVVRKSSGYYANLLLKCARGKYVFWMTDDAIVVPGAILNAYAHFERRLNDGHKLGGLAFYNNDWPLKRTYLGEITLNGVPIAHYGLFLRRALEEMGHYDEEYVFYGLDDDMCCKLRYNGWHIESYPSFICHCAYANVGARLKNMEPSLADTARFRSKWDGILFEQGQEIKREWKEITLENDGVVCRQFLLPFYSSLIRELLLAIVRRDRRFLAYITRIGLRFLKTGRLVVN